MPELTEVVVDRKVLDAFKRRALKLYPKEFLEQIVGRVVDGQARVYAFRELEHEATRFEVVIDEDLDPMTDGEDVRRFDILGTIHTHPQSTIEPSNIDWEAMARDRELVMGICAIRKTAKRRFVSFAFYNGSKKLLQLTIAEDQRAEAAKTAG
ncbi:MAG TPA: Mov34/MPN/PAD-1 family protein [Terriglobales bacterium]|nr:Mov34/MPN/PAD-1 family protein [Terriglobales bacterium]